jgi:hypothetical protein
MIDQGGGLDCFENFFAQRFTSSGVHKNGSELLPLFMEQEANHF